MGSKSASVVYDREVKERIVKALEGFSEPVWDPEITSDWSWTRGAGKQSELAAVITVDAFCGEGQHKERYKTFLDTYAIVTSLLLTIVGVQIIQPPDFNTFRDGEISRKDAVLNIHVVLLVISFVFYMLALLLTAITLEAIARTMTIRDYAIFIKYRGKLAGQVPKLFIVGIIAMILSYGFLCGVIYSHVSLAFMIIGIVVTIFGFIYFGLRLQVLNSHLNPRHKEQYALVQEVLMELSAQHVPHT